MEKHKVYLEDYTIRISLVRDGQYFEFFVNSKKDIFPLLKEKDAFNNNTYITISSKTFHKDWFSYTVGPKDMKSKWKFKFWLWVWFKSQKLAFLIEKY